MTRKIKILLALMLATSTLTACGQKQSTQHHSDSEYSSLKKKNSQLKKQVSSQSSSKSDNSQANNQPSQPRYSDEDYAMMAFLKLETDDETPDEAVNNLKTSHDNMHWYPHGNRYSVDFGAHTTTMVVNDQDVQVIYDTTEGDHKGQANGHKTYSKQELSQEFGKYKDTIDQILHN